MKRRASALRLAAVMLACAVSGCGTGPRRSGPVDEVERLRRRLPGDALAYALMRPADVRLAMDEIGGKLEPLEPRWGEPGVLWRDSLAAIGVPVLRTLVAGDTRSLVGVAFLRSSVRGVTERREALRKAFNAGVDPQCPVALGVHVARLTDPEHPSPPAAWRLPVPPSHAQPITLRASADRAGLADTDRALRRLCERSDWSDASPEAASEAMERADACGAAWSASPLAAHRLDLGLASTVRGVEVRAALELTMSGATALRAALETPPVLPLSETSFMSLRVRYDHARARAVFRDRISVGPVPGCELHAALAPAFRWPSAAVPSLPGRFADDVAAGLTTLAIDIGPLPQALFGAQVVADYARPAATMTGALRRVGLALSPGVPSVTEIPLVGSTLTVTLDEVGPRASRVRMGFAVPPPTPGPRVAEEGRVGALVVRPSRWGALAALLSGSGWQVKPFEVLGRRVEEVALEVALVPPRLEAVGVLRWKLEGPSK